jgi:fluoroquinolone transport system ATP-binding protein
VIEVDGLSFTYRNARRRTLSDLSFSIAPGEIFGFLGPSGAGKSTTQKILYGLLKQYSGNARVLERELRSITPDFYEHIGVVFEFPHLFTRFTAQENLQYFAGLYRRSTRSPGDLLESVGLQEDTHTRVSAFSKGMRMRLNLCRGLIHDPEVLFLDEPTSGLDPVSARRVKDIILEQKARGKTIFLTTHVMSVADELCDRVAFLVDGRTALIDSPRELRISRGKRLVRVEYLEGERRRVREFELAGLGQDPGFIELLRTVPIETIHTQEATLEDIFIDVTGKALQ